MISTLTETKPERWYAVHSSPGEDDQQVLYHVISLAYSLDPETLPFQAGIQPGTATAFAHLATLTSPKCTPTQAELLARAWLRATQAEDLDVECTWYAWPTSWYGGARARQLQAAKRSRLRRAIDRVLRPVRTDLRRSPSALT